MAACFKWTYTKMYPSYIFFKSNVDDDHEVILQEVLTEKMKLQYHYML